MALREKLETAIFGNSLKLKQLRKERDDLEKKKHFNEQLEYAYNKRCDEIRDLYCKINAYLEVLKWMDEE